MDKSNLLASLSSQGFPQKIVEAFKKVPREDFLPPSVQELSYEDSALPLEKGATISQPYTIAFMLNLLELKTKLKILEIGSGCGYVLALLEEITENPVYGIEIIPSLANKSKQTLKQLNYKSKVYVGNGFKGLKNNAPFDRILISAESPTIPEHLYPQLKDKGILVTPYKDSILQITKRKDKIRIKEHEGFIFVPLVMNAQQQV